MNDFYKKKETKAQICYAADIKSAIANLKTQSSASKDVTIADKMAKHRNSLVKEALKDKILHITSNTIFKNMASLGLLQLGNYIIPILIIPFVTRALGIEAFAKVAYAQNIITYLTILVNYGFEHSATQDIAINKNEKKTVKEIFWSVICFKALLLLISFAALTILYFVSEQVATEPKLYLYAALINLGFVLFPTWFFQGVEEMGKMAIFNFAIKLLGAICIFSFIHSPNDYHLYILILSVSYVIVGIIALLYVLYKYELYNQKEKLTPHLGSIKKGFPIFINNCFNSLYGLAGLTVIGIYLTDSEIGIYAGCQKVIMAVIMFTCMPFSTALFPKVSRLFKQDLVLAWKYYKKMIYFCLLAGFLMAILIGSLAPYIVYILLGSEFTEAVLPIRLMSIIPLLVLLGTTLTVQGLYGCQLQRYAPYIGFISGVGSLLLCLLLIPRIGILGAIVGWYAAQLIELCCSGTLLIRYKRNLDKCST